ncbi:MAG: RusA family crossover junction endodeoxyribonuclease, partial [Nitrosomonas sp.]|nr:RusA family crossover junction endodeoxyribonuclease [Nitrosomonas sp.]
NSRPIFKNKKTGRPFLGKSADLRECENTLLRELRERAAQHGILKPLSHRLHALFIFGFPPEHFYTKRLTENRRLGDCSNLSQIVEDSLQKAGIIADDFYLCPITIDRVCSDKMMVFIQLEG